MDIFNSLPEYERLEQWSTPEQISYTLWREAQEDLQVFDVWADAIRRLEAKS